MKRLHWIVMTGALVSPFAASAEIGYSYVEGFYINTDVEGFDDSADGFGVRGSLRMGRNLHIVGSWIGRDVETPVGDFDFDRSTFGIGAHFAITDNADWLLDVEYLNQDFDVTSDEDGYQVTTGFRALASEAFEVDGGIRYADLDDSEAFGYLRGIYFLDDNWGLTGEFEAGEDDHSFLLGARLNF